MKSEKTSRTSIAVFTLFTVVSVLGAALFLPSAMQADNDDEFTTFTVDIAQDGANTYTQISKNYVQNNVNPAAGQLVFTRGDTFIVNGTIYPGGKLPSGKANNDPNAPGGIGKYRMTGTLATDSANFERAIARLPGADPLLALGTEVFSFPDDGATILTDGLWPNAHFSFLRVILGGTGRFRAVVGETLTQNIGENATGFCNLRVTFRIKKAGGDRH